MSGEAIPSVNVGEQEHEEEMICGHKVESARIRLIETVLRAGGYVDLETLWLEECLYIIDMTMDSWSGLKSRYLMYANTRPGFEWV